MKHHLTKLFLFMVIGQDREKSKLTVASAAETSKSAAAKLAAKVERFKQSRKSHSETRIVGGVAINTTVGKDVPLSVQSSSVSVKSEPELDNIKNKVQILFNFADKHYLNLLKPGLHLRGHPTYCTWVLKAVLAFSEAS